MDFVTLFMVFFTGLCCWSFNSGFGAGYIYTVKVEEVILVLSEKVYEWVCFLNAEAGWFK